MRTVEITYDHGTPIDGYGPGFFRLAGAVHRGPLAIVPGGVLVWDGLPQIGPFLTAAAGFDVLLVGTGPEIRPLPADLRGRLEAAGIGVEIMATPSACRTYNVLLAEGRRVAAALVPL